MFDPRPSHAKDFKNGMVLAALSLGAHQLESRARNRNWSAQCQYNVTGWTIMSSV